MCLPLVSFQMEMFTYTLLGGDVCTCVYVDRKLIIVFFGSRPQNREKSHHLALMEKQTGHHPEGLNFELDAMVDGWNFGQSPLWRS